MIQLYLRGSASISLTLATIHISRGFPTAQNSPLPTQYKATVMLMILLMIRKEILLHISCARIEYTKVSACTRGVYTHVCVLRLHYTQFCWLVNYLKDIFIMCYTHQGDITPCCNYNSAYWSSPGIQSLSSPISYHFKAVQDGATTIIDRGIVVAAEMNHYYCTFSCLESSVIVRGRLQKYYYMRRRQPMLVWMPKLPWGRWMLVMGCLTVDTLTKCLYKVVRLMLFAHQD